MPENGPLTAAADFPYAALMTKVTIKVPLAVAPEDIEMLAAQLVAKPAEDQVRLEVAEDGHLTAEWMSLGRPVRLGAERAVELD